MDGYRTLLAALSLVCGLILFFAAGRRYFLKRSARAPLALSFYGLLFVFCAFLLGHNWFGQPIRRAENVQKPAAPQTETQETKRVTEIPVAKGGDTTAQVSTSRLEETAVLPSASAPLQIHSEPVRPTARRKNDAATTVVGDGNLAQLPFEDRAYFFVSHAFVSVEQWFMRYGSPASAKHRATETVTMEFPHVLFHFGTAELQGRSRDELVHYADYLKSQSEPSLIEIQAYSNEGGMEPFNYILTQARAEAVRDVLVENGVSTQRLVPVARGSQGTDSLGLSSHVRFVTRP